MKTLLVLVAVSWAVPAYCEPAASFRGDERHSGIYQGEGVPVLHGLKWKFTTNGPVVSTPAVVDDTVYVGSNDHYFYALAVATGAVRWKFKTGSRVTSSPAVADGQVYFGSYDGYLYALDARSGALRWKFQTAGEHRFAAKHLHGAAPDAEVMPDPFDFFLSSPAIIRGVVYVGSGDGYVYALDAASGELRWKFRTGNVVHASPAVANDTVYVGSWDSYFYALDARTGQERWRFKTGEDAAISNQVGIQSSAVIAEGLVFFGCRDSNLYALDAMTGERKWAFSNKGSWVISTPIVLDETLYFATSDSGLLHAANAKTGVLLYTLGFHRWPMFSSPVIAGRRLYIGTHAGTLVSIDLDKRTTAWTFRTDGAVRNGPTLTKSNGEPNYEAAFSDFFYDNLVIGVWQMMSVGAVLSSPVIASDTIVFGSADGNVYALQ